MSKTSDTKDLVMEDSFHGSKFLAAELNHVWWQNGDEISNQSQLFARKDVMLFVCQRVSASRQCFENPPLPNHFPNQSVLQGTVLHAIIDQEWLLMSCPHLHASPIIETYQDICLVPHPFLLVWLPLEANPRGVAKSGAQTAHLRTAEPGENGGNHDVFGV
jgi:hypothetical protein